MNFWIKTLFLLVLLTWAHSASAGQIEIPVPPGLDPPSGPVYRLRPQASGEFNDPQHLGSVWMYGKTIHYTSKTQDAFFIVFTDGTVLHTYRNWNGQDLGDMGLSEEMDWSAMVAVGTGGLVNGLVMDLLDVGSSGLWVSDWVLRRPTTTIPESTTTGPFYWLASKEEASSAQSEERIWLENKRISYMYYSDGNNLLSLVFTDGTGIWIGNQRGVGSSNWEYGGEADWEALVATGAMAMGTSRKVNLLVEGGLVVSWTLH